MLDISYFLIFLMGFFGGVHCVGMCGGLSSAFVLQLPPGVSRFQLVFCLNAGRIVTYVLIGLGLGLVGQIGSHLPLGGDLLRDALFVFAQCILLLMGLYLVGASAAIVRFEKVGLPIWRRLQPFMQRWLPIKNQRGAFFVGLIWGWLPCGLVYSASSYALSSADALRGLLLMLAFGLGTLPNLLAMGLFAASLARLLQKKSLRIAAGSLMMAWAIWQLLLFWQPRPF